MQYNKSLPYLESGIGIIIAVSHSGYEVEKKMAREVNDLDLVVGGHSHAFLFSGQPPSKDKPLGPYPTLEKQLSGKIVPVVQAHHCSKYLGYLKMTFTRNGELKSWSGSPILLNSSFTQSMFNITMMSTE